MTGGYAGKIVRVNLTTRAINTIDTAQYEESSAAASEYSGIWQ